jgi:hypothetical protein
MPAPSFTIEFPVSQGFRRKRQKKDMARAGRIVHSIAISLIFNSLREDTF